MMHTLQYTEMNQAVPGASLSPGHEGGGGGGGGSYGECQVPSPSQWSDPCYSPPSFHSPQHLPVELEKIKEEPYSPSPASYLNLPASPPPSHHLSSPSSMAPHHGVASSSSPYGRPSSNGSGGGAVGHVIKKDAYESCINLSDLLNENQSLVQQHHPHHHHHHSASSPSSPPYGGGYLDHPLLRGRLEDAFQKMAPLGGSPPPPQSFDGSFLHHHMEDQSPPPFHQKMSPQSVVSPDGGFKDTDEGLSFLESLVDVKRELEDDVNVGSSCGSPAVPSPGGAAGQLEVAPQSQGGPCQSDILATVELLAQEHNRMDVQRVSDSLNIPRDPALWSVEDVRAWLKLQASQLNLPPLMLDFWNYGGPSLLKLTEQQFRQLAPIGGELLYAKLEIWREALRSSPKLSSSSSSLSPTMMDHHRQAYAFLHHHHQVVVSQQHEANNLMLLSPPHHVQLQHHLQQQQQQQQQVVLPSGGSSPSGASSMAGSAPSSPPLPLVSSLSQVPTSVAQVSQQQQANNGSPAPPSPQQQQQHQGSTAAATAVYLDEPCLDMAALLQQQPPANTSSSSKGSSPRGSLKPPSTHGSSSQEETYDSEEEVEEETCITGGSGRGGTHIHLWQFLKELLQQPQLYGSCIRWLDRQKGVFKIEDSVRVARLWGKRKNRPAMNYDKLSRSIRQYYKKGIMKKTERSQRLVYQFCHPYCL